MSFIEQNIIILSKEINVNDYHTPVNGNEMSDEAADDATQILHH